MKRLRLAIPLVAMLALSGCGTTDIGSTLASWSISAASSLSTAGPSDLKTYPEATEAVDLATLTIDVTAVNARALGLHKPVLQKLYALNEALHAAWVDLKASYDNKQSLDFGAVQAAWDAYNTFRVQQNIPEAPLPPPAVAPVS